MAVDFTVVSAVRQRFGDRKNDATADGRRRESGLEDEAPFVGAEKAFPFQCPGVDRNQFAMLLFQSMGVTRPQTLEINGQLIFGGIPVSVDVDNKEIGGGADAHRVQSEHARWHGNVMLVHPGVLSANNVLRIRTSETFLDTPNLDDFIIDNVVVVFKTGAGGVVGPRPTTTTARSKRPTKKSAPKKAAKRRR